MSAIVVNWNGAHLLADCLETLKSQTHAPLEILVVDNGSTDNSEHVVNACGVSWVPLSRNVGLARAFNAGAELARNDLLLFLNNDMRFEPTFVERMVACLERNERCVAVDAIQFDWHNAAIVHEATRLRPGGLRDPLPGWQFRSVGAMDDELTIWPSGANTLIRAGDFEKLGRWDPRFFAGYEDVDFGWRIWLFGGEVRVASDAVCWHRVGASSSGDGHRIRSAASVHGALLFALKHAPARTVLLAVTRSVVLFANAVFKRDTERAGIHGGALWRLACQLPQALTWRVRTFRSAGKSAAEHWRLMAQL